MTARSGDPTPSGPPVIRESLQGRYSGFASRFAAFAVDIGVSLGAFMLNLRRLVRCEGADRQGHLLEQGRLWVTIAYAVWAFIYFAYSWAASGRTAGMALFGVRVVRDAAPTRAGAGRSRARWRCR